MELDQAVCVVTGGGSGIGEAVMGALREQGATPVAWDIRPPPGGIACDVSEGSSVAAAMEETMSRLGAPNVMVTCAGVGSFQTLESLERAEWERVLSVNLTGTMLCLQAAAKTMRRGGSVVCVSSINGRIPDRGMSAYCCSKAGVDMLARVAAVELAAKGIRVNAVAPGVTETPMLEGARALPGFVERVSSRTPLGGLGSARQVADAVVALVRTDWVTAQSLPVDGGLGVLSPVDTYGLVTSSRSSP